MTQTKIGFGKNEEKVAGHRTKGHFLTLITGKGNNTKSSSKFLSVITVFKYYDIIIDHKKFNY